MISWVVASHDPTVLDANLGATLQLIGDDELVVVRDAPSIAAAYRDGQAQARQPVRCYVHHDVQVLDTKMLRRRLLEHCLPDVGMVGVVGSTTEDLPWWDGLMVGRVEDARLGMVGPGGGGPCKQLDGLLLATAQHVPWDQRYPGWHMYDHDSCRQMTARGLPNWCLDGGDRLVRHNTTGATNTNHLQHYAANVARFKAKWGADG